MYSPSPTAIFDRAKALFRSRLRPPFVVYTVSRVERIDGMPDFENTYTTRVWFRASDGAALTRRTERGRAVGPLVFARPRFNAPLDPGPPTADIFERAPAYPRATVPATATPAMPTIGNVVAPVESDYRVSLGTSDAETYHLLLVARREPDRNRLSELWVERATWSVRRAIAADRLYFGEGPNWIADRLDIRFDSRDGLPTIARISASTDVDVESRENGPHEEGEYRFGAMTFPASLPAWYFRPEEYGRHSVDAPS
ncbi:MAG: hypothetical protein ABI346_02465 [Candidatus Baltobacteraceae bacterium]